MQRCGCEKASDSLSASARARAERCRSSSITDFFTKEEAADAAARALVAKTNRSPKERDGAAEGLSVHRRGVPCKRARLHKKERDGDPRRPNRMTTTMGARRHVADAAA